MGVFFRSYLRVNQVSLQDIACVPQNACPTLTGKKEKEKENQTLALFATP